VGILLTEILLILVFIGVYVFFNYKRKSISQLIIESSLLALFFGTPIIFTSITRSVFEVSKMYLLRLSQLIIIFILFINYTRGTYTQTFKLPNQNLSKALWIWVGVNILTFVFAPNKYIAFIGAYDRWDGILTMLNYVVLFYLILQTVRDKAFVFWLIGALLFTGGLSAIYGIYQSFGMDFMNWSVDPTARVFACINNPVHFSAYIAMLVLPAIALLHYSLKHFKVNLKELLNIPKPQLGLFILLLISIFAMHYTASFLSFGRATWVGFSFALMFFYFFLFKLYHREKIVWSFINFTLGMLVVIAFFVFKVHEAKAVLGFMLILLSLIFIGTEYYLFKNPKDLLTKMALLVLAAQMQFVTVSFIAFFMCLIMIAAIYFLCNVEYKKLHLFILMGLVLVLFIPSFKTNYVQLEVNKRIANQVKIWKETKTEAMPYKDYLLIRNTVIGEMINEGKIDKTEGNVLYRTATYSSDFKSGSARTAMWQSAVGLSLKNLMDPQFKAWIKEYPLLGTGPGTIKAFFPKFRRPDYGRLEGGHNFTPDKLHNDYLDTIATHGLLGFISYFVFFIPLCGYLALKQIKENPEEVSNILLIGLSAGVIVYLGQTLFNFGVVATKVLYYELLGLAVALILNQPFKNNENN